MMVRTLHAAGIEVILDVVYNHTCEGNQMGPTLSLARHRQRQLLPPHRRGQTLLHGFHRLRQHAEHDPPARAAAHHGQPALLGDGNARRRVPLRPGQHARARAARGGPARRVLRHHPPGPDPLAGQADRRAVGRRARRVPGRQFPGAVDRVERQVPRQRPQILERRRRHRSASSRRGWPAAATCTRTTAASRTRASTSSPCHDGFSLQDLVSYDHKHNEANGEDNRDGADDNHSWNCGAEGPTDDPTIIALRERQKRNLIATLMFSEGVPMIFAGDELSHTKNGNNNTYCQDNELTWLNWDLDERRQKFLDFVRTCTQIWASSRCCSAGSSSSAGRSAARASRTSRSSTPPATR